LRDYSLNRNRNGANNFFGCRPCRNQELAASGMGSKKQNRHFMTFSSVKAMSRVLSPNRWQIIQS